MALVRWNPTQDVVFNIQDEMNRLFTRFFGPDLFETPTEVTGTWYPTVDICENKDELLIMVDLPGMQKEDFHISYRNGQLVIEGERKLQGDKNLNYYRSERRYGKFYRSFTLPVAIKEDQIEASYKDGILTVHLPKAEEAKVKEISVRAS